MNAATRIFASIFLVIFTSPQAAFGAGADLNQIPCACATVVDSQIPGPLAGGGGKILANLSKSNSFTKAGYDLGKFHECQHNIGGPDEAQADAQGAELACRAGMLTEEAVQNVCAIVINSRSSTGKHPPGPQRCQTYRTALQNCKNGGGGGGGGGGSSCAGGRAFQVPQVPDGGQQRPGERSATGKIMAGQGFSSVTRENPDDSNPFKTGTYVQEAAKADAAEGWPAAILSDVPKGKSSPPLSDITRTAQISLASADRTGAESGRHAASARIDGESVNGNGGKGGYFDGSVGLHPLGDPSPETVGSYEGKLAENSAGASTAGPQAKNASTEVAEAYSKPLSSPVMSLNSGEVANALKDLVPAPEPAASDIGQSLFERCHAAHRRAYRTGKL